MCYKVYPTKNLRGFVATYVSTREQAEREKEKMERLTWIEWAVKETGRIGQ